MLKLGQDKVRSRCSWQGRDLEVLFWFYFQKNYICAKSKMLEFEG